MVLIARRQRFLAPARHRLQDRITRPAGLHDHRCGKTGFRVRVCGQIFPHISHPSIHLNISLNQIIPSLCCHLQKITWSAQATPQAIPGRLSVAAGPLLHYDFWRLVNLHTARLGHFFNLRKTPTTILTHVVLVPAPHRSGTKRRLADCSEWKTRLKKFYLPLFLLERRKNVVSILEARVAVTTVNGILTGASAGGDSRTLPLTTSTISGKVQGI